MYFIVHRGEGLCCLPPVKVEASNKAGALEFAQTHTHVPVAHYKVCIDWKRHLHAAWKGTLKTIADWN